MGRIAELDEHGIPNKCKTCRQFVRSGEGNQEQTKDDKIDRYCNGCWKEHCEEIGGKK